MGVGILIMFINRNFLPFRIDSSLVGFFFFSLGMLFKEQWNRIFKYRVYVNLLGFIMSLAVLYVIFFYCFLELNPKQGFSININYYGPMPWMFIISGLIGTYMMLSISNILAKKKIYSIYVFSTGMVIPLGFQKIIMFTMCEYFPNLVRPVVCVVTIILSYVLILLAMKYAPAIIGYRNLINLNK